MRPPAPPPIERETITQVPTFERPPKELPFPPGSYVRTLWHYVGGQLFLGVPVGGEWVIASERLATDEEVAAERAEWQNVPNLRPYEEAVPTTEVVLGALQQLAEKDREHRPLPPTSDQRAAEVRARRRWWAQRAGVPAALVEHLKYLDDRPALTAVRAWDRGDKRALLLHGANQSGKSVAAAAWLSTFERGRWAAADEIGLATQPDPQGQGTAWLRQLRGASALVIDNIGARCGPAGYEEIEALVMHHLAAGRRLVVTTDLSARDFFVKFGEVPADEDVLAGPTPRSRVLARWRLVGAVEQVKPYRQLELRAGGAT